MHALMMPAAYDATAHTFMSYNDANNVLKITFSQYRAPSAIAAGRT